MRHGRGFSASPAQRRRVAGKTCLACGASPCDPAHLTSRGQGGCDDPLCVVPLCRGCHRAFDEHRLDLLPYWPRMVAELQHAIGHLGPSGLIVRLTGREWASMDKVAA